MQLPHPHNRPGGFHHRETIRCESAPISKRSRFERSVLLLAGVAIHSLFKASNCSVSQNLVNTVYKVIDQAHFERCAERFGDCEPSLRTMTWVGDAVEWSLAVRSSQKSFKERNRSVPNFSTSMPRRRIARDELPHRRRKTAQLERFLRVAGVVFRWKKQRSKSRDWWVKKSKGFCDFSGVGFDSLCFHMSRASQILAQS